MAATIEVKYFNSFLLKKQERTTSGQIFGLDGVWNGSFGIPAAKGGYPVVLLSLIHISEPTRPY